MVVAEVDEVAAEDEEEDEEGNAQGPKARCAEKKAVGSGLVTALAYRDASIVGTPSMVIRARQMCGKCAWGKSVSERASERASELSGKR